MSWWNDAKGWISDNILDPAEEGINSLGSKLTGAGNEIKSGLLNPISNAIATVYTDVKSGGETVYADAKEVASYYGDQASKVVDTATELPGKVLDTGKEIISKTEDTLFNPFTMLAIGAAVVGAAIILK